MQLARAPGAIVLARCRIYSYGASGLVALKLRAKLRVIRSIGKGAEDTSPRIESGIRPAVYASLAY